MGVSAGSPEQAHLTVKLVENSANADIVKFVEHVRGTLRILNGSARLAGF